MDYLTILNFIGLKLSPAIVVFLSLLLYINKKLNYKVDKKDFDLFKKEFLKTLEEKLDASNDIMRLTVKRVESVFEVQNGKMQQIVDIQVKALSESIGKLEKRE